jgi:hypothetical protein
MDESTDDSSREEQSKLLREQVSRLGKQNYVDFFEKASASFIPAALDPEMHQFVMTFGNAKVTGKPEVAAQSYFGCEDLLYDEAMYLFGYIAAIEHIKMFRQTECDVALLLESVKENIEYLLDEAEKYAIENGFKDIFTLEEYLNNIVTLDNPEIINCYLTFRNLANNEDELAKMVGLKNQGKTAITNIIGVAITLRKGVAYYYIETLVEKWFEDQGYLNYAHLN